LKDNEKWESDCEDIMAKGDYSKSAKAKELLNTVRNDKEENYNLLDKQMIRRLSIWYIKSLCEA
jgi:hypothetical protein